MYVVCNSATCICWWMWLLENLSSQNLIPTQNVLKVKLSLSTPCPQIGGVEVQLHPFLPWALECKRSISRPVNFTSGIGPLYPLNRGLRAGLKVLEKRILAPTGIRAPDRLSRYSVAIPTGPSRFPSILTLILLTWRIWWAPNNVRRWQVGFNSAFKG
jgi:hypothetical protein